MIKIYLIVLTCMFQANLSKAGETIVITVDVGDNQALIDAINIANAATNKSNLESTTPITIVQRNDIEDTYVVSLSDLLNNQTSFIDLKNNANVTLRGLEPNKRINYVGENGVQFMNSSGNSRINISNARFSEFSAQQDAGVFNVSDESGLTLNDVLFEGNSGFAGGAIGLKGNSFLNATRITLRGNSSMSSGGGIDVQGTSWIHIRDSDFESNSTPMDGGAINFGGSSYGKISGSKFSDNSATNGCGINVNTSAIEQILLEEDSFYGLCLGSFFHMPFAM